MYLSMTIPLAMRSKECICACGFEYRRDRGCLLSVLCVLQSGVSETDRLLVRKSPTECGACERDFEISAMRKSRPTRAVQP